MNARYRANDWVEANQRLLVAEFGRLKARLRRGDVKAALAMIERQRAVMPAPAAIDTLAGRFGLSRFERDVVLLTAGVEMDSELAQLCASASGNPSHPWATFGLALAALDEPHWSALAPGQPLRRWHLIEVDEAGLLTSARVRIAETVLHHLAGVDDIDGRLAPLLHPMSPPTFSAASHSSLGERIVETWQTDEPLIVQLHGNDASGREDVAACAAAMAGYRLMGLAAPALPASTVELALLASLWQRDALLGRRGLFIDATGEPPTAALRDFLERLDVPVFVSVDAPILLRRRTQQWRVELPNAEDQLGLWRDTLGPAPAIDEDAFGAVVSHFSLSAQRIASVAASLPSADVDVQALWRACRDTTPTRLDELSQRVVPKARWEDLILPDAQTQTLQQIVVHMRKRYQVHERWGFGERHSRGLGVTVLFAGDSGTGKTLAAEVLANTLGLQLYRIDLSGVVSKYIGETEKNLRRVFEAAEDSGAILLFDEADALFGKRSEVRDSHDRYANIEVSYLLQRMETYRGLAILTTNHKAALDPAFLRRLRFIVHFPFPESAEREAIWRRAFPPETPTDNLAWDKLARLQVAGGHIQNIALAAAFHAAEAGEPVGMAHLLRAAREDARKRERTIADAETRGWL